MVWAYSIRNANDKCQTHDSTNDQPKFRQFWLLLLNLPVDCTNLNKQYINN